MADGAGRSIYWQPNPKQVPFLASTADELLGGGGGGGGKTEAGEYALLGPEVQGIQYPRFRAIALRRKQKDLRDLRDRCERDWTQLFPGVVFSGQYPTVATFPSGASVVFSGITPDFENDHQGFEYQSILWEELCQQPTPNEYEYMLTRLRCGWSDMPLRSMGTCNPWGPGRAWVRNRFRIDPAGSPTHFYATRILENGERIRTRRQFVQMLAKDNPHVGEDYMRRLKSLPPMLRKALHDGRWDVAMGQFFTDFNPAYHVRKAFDPPANWPRWRSLDWGFAKPYSVHWHAMDPDGNIHTYRELYGWGGKPNVGSRETADVVARRILELEDLEKKSGIRIELSPADPSIWINQGTGRAEQSIGHVFRANGVEWASARETDNSRKAGWQQITMRLRNTVQKKPGGMFIHDCCVHLLRTLPELLASPDDPDDVDTDMEDHAADELRYGYMRRRLPPREEKTVVQVGPQMVGKQLLMPALPAPGRVGQAPLVLPRPAGA